MRALVLSNMAPSADAPGRGAFVRTQVAALRRVGGVEVELEEFAPGMSSLARAARTARGHRGFDVVHAHFGLTAYAALAVPGAKRVLTVHGTDVHHPRTGRLTRLVARRMDLVAAVSQPLADELGAGTQVLPIGVDLGLFRPLDRAECRTRLGLDPQARLALLPTDPARPEKRADRAREVAAGAEAQLLTLGRVAAEEMPVWINAADAVLVPSEREGFGLAAIEALACDVPVLATPVGAHPEALEGVAGTLCAAYDRDAWTEALRAAPDRVEGRGRAERWSADTMAGRVIAAWRSLVDSNPEAPGEGALVP